LVYYQNVEEESRLTVVPCDYRPWLPLIQGMLILTVMIVSKC
jgi:hypothetical protein